MNKVHVRCVLPFCVLFLSGASLTVLPSNSLTRTQYSRQRPQRQNTYHSPAFSPDGKKVAFIERKAQEDQRLCIADLDTGNIFRFPEVFTEPAYSRGLSVSLDRPAFSPDGRTIVFEAYSSDFGCSLLYLANLDGTHLRRLTACDSYPSRPIFSPDGKYIAFNYNSNKIKVIDLEGRAISMFPSDVQESVQTEFTFSPDGRHILYLSSHAVTGIINVYLENFRNKTRTKVAELQHEFHSGAFQHASISPDGKTIAFTMPMGPRNPQNQRYNLSRYEVLLTSLVDTRRIRLTSDNNFDNQPIFTGAGILFTSSRLDSSANYEESAIYIMNKDGSHRRLIAQGKQINSFIVSPKADRIAFEDILPSGDADVFIVNLDGTGRTALRDLLSSQSSPLTSTQQGQSAIHQSADRPKPTDLGPNHVWSFKEDGLWEKIHEKCRRNGGFGAWRSSAKKTGVREKGAQAPFVQCIASQMHRSGASPQALAFTRKMKGESYMGQFREMGKVDLATIVAPVINDPNVVDFILVNGTPQIVYLWENAEKIDLARDALYSSLRSRFPNITMWPMHSFVEMQRLVEGGQRFIFSFILLNGCRACEIAGSAEIAFDFDKEGRFLGAKLVGLKEPSGR